MAVSEGVAVVAGVANAAVLVRKSCNTFDNSLVNDSLSLATSIVYPNHGV